ncbi:MAG: ribbon-helix-helix domain-containing protein [Planctomycetes bacterium]|nr:ribbon-helix-helix domain-containing protein [Planctomycetota bacterium]
MKRKPPWEKKTAELAEETAQFDKEFAADAARSMTPAERKRWNRVKRKPGRPREGKGFQRISVSIEKGLLKQVTKVAKQRHISRSKLLAEAVQEILAANA